MSSDTMTFWRDLEDIKTLLRTDRSAEADTALAALAATTIADDPMYLGPRLALLRDVARIYGLTAPGAPAANRILVSGIGRSGTTLIYQQLAKLLLLETEAVNFRYEPYLWNIRAQGTAGNSFGTDQIHHFGLHTHLATPLFLAGAHEIHDAFLDTLFDAPLDRDPDSRPDACLTKVIRGSGRLRAYLARFPDLKLVICLRNPLDTINSSLGMFSFFGDEFHENDRARFAAELRARGRLPRPLPDAQNAVEWYGAWWRAFTDESLAVAADFPDNVFLFCHEMFQQDNTGVLEALQAFVGLKNDGIYMGLNQPAGPSIRATSLTVHDMMRLAPDSAFYREQVLERFLGPGKAAAYDARLPRKYAAGAFSFPVAGTDLGRKSPIQLRGMMLNDQTSPFLRLAKGPRSPVQLDVLLERHGGGAPPEALQMPVRDARGLRRDKRFGAVITCHNNAATIADAVLSCLNQTLPYDEIVVVDDHSSDDSRQKLEVLADRYSSLRLVPLDSGLGPSAARDLGIRRLTTEFFTQLDGDDLFWPTKNAEEAAALDGDETAVAFSDILLVLPDKSLIQDTGAHAGPAGPQRFARLLARAPQIPRDMTLARARYFEAGGYNLMSHLYEDWEFKLRLAALPGGEWRRAGGVAGTVYNRLTPGLSGADPGRHARALVLIFLRALAHGKCEQGALVSAFDAALRPFAGHSLAAAARTWLMSLIEHGRYDPAAVAALAATRQIGALDDAALTTLFRNRTAQGVKEDT